MEKIDKLDRQILNIISKNARIPFKDVAEECGVSRAAIHQRVQRMIDMNVIVGSGYQRLDRRFAADACRIKIYFLDSGRPCLWRKRCRTGY